ncbi:MAG: PEP-CTERM sorting domain-containing protein [Planctomycetes bacterium]|nr:PEP-CTERM sorting domain-containing protein [Planctomycetota bacterium]
MLNPPTAKRVSSPLVRLTAIILALSTAAASPALASPWAGNWVSYNPGSTPVFGYTNPATALGLPERFTGENEFGGLYQSAVTMFNPVFGTDEAVSIGEGGHLTLALDTPATDDAGHLYGVDLILFGNSFFSDSNYPNGQQEATASLFSAGQGRIELSADGVNFIAVPGWTADRLFPTQGYLDVDANSTTPGGVPADFLKPMNPSLTLADFNGLSYAQSLALYDGSGGGTPIDISLVGLSSVTHVRISVDDDFNPNTSLAAEIDAVAAVPEPTSLSILLVACMAMTLRRSRPSCRG